MKKHYSSAFYSLMALMGGIFWGFSGTCGQYLFQVKGFDSGWLTAIRLLSSGFILIVIAALSAPRDLLSLLGSGKDLLLTIAFGIIGIVPCQYCYLTAIQYSNSGTATVLQYLGPVMIMLLVCLKDLRLPTVAETAAVVLAICGTFLIATHGNLHALMISRESLFWGLLSAVGYVLYAIIPTGLMTRHSSVVVSGLGMLFGSIPMLLIMRPWQTVVSFDIESWLVMAGIVIIGTVLAYTMFMLSIGGIGPAKASLIACIEPVAATLFSTVWLHTVFAKIDLLGFAMIIGTVILLTYLPPKQQTKERNQS